MECLDFLTQEELLNFFHCKKTEMSCMDQPQTFLCQLRDHNLVSEKLYQGVSKMKKKEQKKKGVYDVLDSLETHQPERVKTFWECVFTDHIMQQYPTLRLLRNSLMDGESVLLPMEHLDFLTQEELLNFFHCKKTEMSCMDQPQTFLCQLRDHNLVSEELYQRVTRMKTKEQKKKGVYEVLDSLETDQPERVKTFWECVFTDHIMQQYPTLRLLRNSLMDESFHESQPEKDSMSKRKNTERENEDMKEKKVKRMSGQKRKRSNPSEAEEGEEEEEEDQAGTSQDTPSMKKKQLQKPTYLLDCGEEEYASSNQEEEEEEEGRDGGSNHNSDVDWSMFGGSTLPVQCGSVIGILHKDRFASGITGKCIRTEERWLTPAEFIRLNPDLTDGMWKRDITCSGQPLGYLVREKLLQVHSLLCMCRICSHTESNLEEQRNDDHCFICGDRGELLCCDGCPRFFHRGCHLPTPTSGEEWLCTFCVWGKSQEWRYTDHMTQPQVLNSRIFDYKLQCQYLLLFLLNADDQKKFTTDPCPAVSGYASAITRPMWLGKVRENLESRYRQVGEFISDIRLIFRNCAVFNRTKPVMKELGIQLSDLFEKEFHNTFNIPESSRNGRKERMTKENRGEREKT